MLENSSVAEQLLATQEGLRSIELVSNVSLYVCFLWYSVSKMFSLRFRQLLRDERRASGRKEGAADACLPNHSKASHLIFTRYGIMQQTDFKRANSVGRTSCYNGNNNWIYVSYLKIIFNVGN
jgi:hypothetical protein